MIISTATDFLLRKVTTDYLDAIFIELFFDIQIQSSNLLEHFTSVLVSISVDLFNKEDRRLEKEYEEISLR